MSSKITLLKKGLYLFVFLVFADNPAKDNQTTVEKLVGKKFPGFLTPIAIKKKKAKKLVFPGPTFQGSEEDDPNTPSNQMEVDSEVEFIPQKGKERTKFPVEQNAHKEVPYPKGKCQICP
ncbi:hypothetical protein O181_041183 [Austropuccinia psidii MF-1]|uniref:Uncharacterized protein n=1 Tax=Austropuccinia psidii MF-1 TaxID=1389203 RepID=A0A9Q3DGW7_9BASI|nr:hypothetical protein [Austropuccinia psidii MF-1]